MNTASKRKLCCNDFDIFYYICENFTSQSQRCNINNFVKKLHLAYMKVALGDQDKTWAPQNVCKTCVET